MNGISHLNNRNRNGGNAAEQAVAVDSPPLRSGERLNRAVGRPALSVEWYRRKRGLWMIRNANY
jgi:hypothetical protein